MAEDEDLSERLRRLQEDAARLEEKKRELERDLKEIEHQTRRAADRVERGESPAALEAERRQLSERRELNMTDQRVTTRQLETLRAEREEVEEWIRQMRGKRTP